MLPSILHSAVSEEVDNCYKLIVSQRSMCSVSCDIFTHKQELRGSSLFLIAFLPPSPYFLSLLCYPSHPSPLISPFPLTFPFHCRREVAPEIQL